MFEVDEIEGCHSCRYGENFDTEKEPCKYCYGLSLYRRKETKMKETNDFEEMAKEEKLLTHILPTTLFCEECGITETSPSFGQRYCRYCGTIFKNKSWFYGKGGKDERMDTTS